MKWTLVVKEPSSKIRVYSEYLEIIQEESPKYVGFKHIRAAYIHKKAELTIEDAMKMAMIFPLYIIDKRGNILGKVCIRR